MTTSQVYCSLTINFEEEVARSNNQGLCRTTLRSSDPAWYIELEVRSPRFSPSTGRYVTNSPRNWVGCWLCYSGPGRWRTLYRDYQVYNAMAEEELVILHSDVGDEEPRWGGNRKFGIPNLLSHANIRLNYLHLGTLKVSVDFILQQIGGREDPPFVGAVYQIFASSLTEVASTNKTKIFLNEEFQEDAFTDCKVVAGEKVFFTHRNILALHSPVMRAALTSSCQERDRREIAITDFAADTVRLFLQVLYGIHQDMEALPFEQLKDLYIILDKYAAEEQSKVCEDAICSKVDHVEDAIVAVVPFAFQHNIQPVIDRCVDFCANMPPDSWEKPEWENLIKENPQLFTKIGKSMATRFTPKTA